MVRKETRRMHDYKKTKDTEKACRNHSKIVQTFQLLSGICFISIGKLHGNVR